MRVKEAMADEARRMIDEGGEEAEQFEPAYHYLAGYCALEAGNYETAIEHLKQADPNDPFQRLLLARAYEKAGQDAEALAVSLAHVDLLYLGLNCATGPVEMGEHIKYLILARERPVACLLWGSAAWKVECRDRFIGSETGDPS